MNKLFQGKTALAAETPAGIARLTEHLESIGFKVVPVTAQSAALEEIAAQKFDLAVTALGLEFEDSGFVICHRVRCVSPETRRIIVTGLLHPEEHFDLSDEDAGNWIRADAILGCEAGFGALDMELERLFGKELPIER